MPLVLAGSTSGSATLQATDAQTVTLTLPASTGTLVVTGGAQTIEFADGSASAPSITNSGDTNTGMFFPAADTIAFTEGGTEAMRLTSAGDVGIGTSTPAAKLHVNGENIIIDRNAGDPFYTFYTGGVASNVNLYGGSTNGFRVFTASTERMRITSSGFVLMGKTTTGLGTNGVEYEGSNGGFLISRGGNPVLLINRNTDDGTLVEFRQDNSTEGSISVSGTTVSYNGGHLSRWSQLLDSSKDDTILKGTVLSNLDEMCVWEKDGVVAANEQLNKMKVSDVEGDTNVAGVFVNWTIDEQYGVDDMNIAMTGDMIIRIADGVVVQKGDLLMSAGDGTAKPQGDDIVRSKTVAKVTSNYVTCTYADGSYCVPCVLMAC
jgi:hypothetical protein